jgi:hypothetical protein
MSARTIQAVRQSLYSALTNPPLSYQVNSGAIQTVPAANVYTMAPFDMPENADKPDPLVNFTVLGRGVESLQLYSRRIEIKVWVSTLTGSDDDVTEIMAAIFGLIESPNSEGVSPLSRAATATTLAVVVREVREIESIAPTYEVSTQRVFADATFHAIVV